MPTLNGRQYTGVVGLNIRKNNGCIRFETPSITPTTTSGERILYCNSSNQLIFNDGSSSTALGASGAVISYSLDDAYNDGNSITVDGLAVTLNASHATNNAFAIAYTGSGTGNMIDIQNSTSGSAGYDIIGTGDTWYFSAAGAAKIASITGCASVTAATNLALEGNGAGTITIGGASTGAITIGGGGGVVAISSASLTIAGAADADALIVTAGDVNISAGQVTITENDTATFALNIVSSGTTGGAIYATANDLVNGFAVTIDSDNAASFGTGGYFSCYNGASTEFSIARYGAVTIAGNAEGTAAITCAKGDLVLTDGALVITAGAFTYTAGDMAMSDGSIAITDADNAASFSVTNNTATSASVIALAGSGVFTGTTTASWMTITPSGLTSGTGVYAIGAGLTTGKLVDLATDATMTSGTILNVQCTGASDAVTSGMAASFDMTATGIASSVNKIGSVVSITSNRTITTGGTTADDFDCLSVIKTTARPAAGTASTTGSVIYAEVAVSGTATETSNGIEVLMDSGGTGDGVKITHSATGGQALNIIGASTSVDDVLITGSDAHTSNLATLQVTNSGNTAALGSILRVKQSGTPTATSYLVEFTNEHATVTSNPVLVEMNNITSTGAVLNLTTAGAASTGHLVIASTNAAAVGPVIYTYHNSASQVADDYVAELVFVGNDDAGTPAANTYGAIYCQVNASVAGSEDGRVEIHASVGGTLTELFAVESTAAGAKDCEIKTATCTLDGSAAGTAALTVTNGDVSLSAGGFVSTSTADQYGLSVTINKASATQGVARFVNSSTTSAKHVLEISQADLDEPYLKLSGATAITSATAGSNGDVPAQVRLYIKIDLDGTDVLIPCYNT